MHPRVLAAAVLTLPLLAACSAGPRDLADRATAQLEEQVPSVVQALQLDTTGGTHQAVSRDPGLLGRTVVYDSRATCSTGSPASCGGVLEEWPSGVAAERRAKTLRQQGDRVVVHGRLLVQLSSQLDASAGEQYRAALDGLS